MLQKILLYIYQGYTIVTQDESHFKDAMLSVRYWAKVERRYSCRGQEDITDSPCCAA